VRTALCAVVGAWPDQRYERREPIDANIL